MGENILERKVKMIKKALWFSIESPTEYQLGEIGWDGYTLIEDAEVKSLVFAFSQVKGWGELRKLMSIFRNLAYRLKAEAIYGVFPTPFLSEIADSVRDIIANGGFSGSEIACFASWGNKEMPEGGESIYTHSAFVYIGSLL